MIGQFHSRVRAKIIAGLIVLVAPVCYHSHQKDNSMNIYQLLKTTVLWAVVFHAKYRVDGKCHVPHIILVNFLFRQALSE